jgi:hypothetical protein
VAPVWAPLALVETLVPVEVPVAYTKTAVSEWAGIRVTGTDIGSGSGKELERLEGGPCVFIASVEIGTETKRVLESFIEIVVILTSSVVFDGGTESEVNFIIDTVD